MGRNAKAKVQKAATKAKNASRASARGSTRESASGSHLGATSSRPSTPQMGELQRPDSRSSMHSTMSFESGLTQDYDEMGEPEEWDDDGDDIEFQPKQVPAKSFNRRGFTIYVMFLALFCYNTLGMGSTVYHMAEFTRNMVSKDDFFRISNAEEYWEWQAVHFFPGLREFSVGPAEDDADGDNIMETAPFRVVSVPRIRQVRSEPCNTKKSFMHITGTCFQPGDWTER
jgi:hypothetical protein